MNEESQSRLFFGVLVDVTKMAMSSPHSSLLTESWSPDRGNADAFDVRSQGTERDAAERFYVVHIGMRYFRENREMKPVRQEQIIQFAVDPAEDSRVEKPAVQRQIDVRPSLEFPLRSGPVKHAFLHFGEL